MKLEDTISKLNELKNSCSKQNWDGYDALPISNSSYLNTLRIINFLPNDLPTPELSVDSDGEVSLEWYVDKEKVFSVSIGTDSFNYAGLFDTGKVHGKEEINSTGRLPEFMLGYVRNLYQLVN